MRTYKRLALPLALTALNGLAAAQAHSTEAEDWQFTVNFPMVWVPDIAGEIDIDGVKNEIEIAFSDILEDLSAGFIGEFDVEKGNWGAAFRAMYLETDSRQTTTAIGLPGQPPLLGKHRLSVESALYTMDLVGSYRVHRNVKLVAGARMTGTDIDFRVKPLEEGAAEIKGKVNVADEDLLDWIAGVDLGFRLSRSWSTTIQADTAFAGDNDTDWQINAYLSYSLSDLNNIWFGYRYLKIGNTEGNGEERVKTSFTQHGPTLGWAFTF